MCGRVGMVTGKGLALIIKKYFPKEVLYFAVLLLFLSNVFNINARFVGSVRRVKADSIIPAPYFLWLFFITLFTLFLEIFVSYPVYAKYLKVLTLSLLSYVFVAFIVKQDWQRIVVSTLIPPLSLDRDYLFSLVAILGANLSPYLFFWQADEEVEEEVKIGRIRAMGRGVPKVTKHDLRNLRMDTIVGMFFSNVIVFFIGVTAASTLGRYGIVDVATADQAALALKPLAGNLGLFLFVLGIVGSGLLAVPTLAGSAAYAIAETFGWREGLSQKFKQAYGFYGAIILATLVGLVINFTFIKPFQLLYLSAILNGILAPPLLALILISGDKKEIMGEYVNSKFSRIFGWLTVILMSLASLLLLAHLFWPFLFS